MSNNSLVNKLSNMAGTDSKGESKASTALASHCASLYVSLAGEADPTISSARDEVAVSKARRSLRTSKTVEAEVISAKLRMKAALAAATPKAEETPEAPAPKARKARNGKSKVAPLHLEESAPLQ